MPSAISGSVSALSSSHSPSLQQCSGDVALGNQPRHKRRNSAMGPTGSPVQSFKPHASDIAGDVSWEKDSQEEAEPLQGPSPESVPTFDLFSLSLLLGQWQVS